MIRDIILVVLRLGGGGRGAGAWQPLQGVFTPRSLAYPGVSDAADLTWGLRIGDLTLPVMLLLLCRGPAERSTSLKA